MRRQTWMIALSLLMAGCASSNSPSGGERSAENNADAIDAGGEVDGGAEEGDVDEEGDVTTPQEDAPPVEDEPAEEDVVEEDDAGEAGDAPCGPFFWPDADGDGFGDVDAEPTCDPRPDFVDNGDDCDDSSAAINPGAEDRPDPAFEDLNCDGFDGDLDATIFVAPFGNDATGAGTVASPVRSLPVAVRFAQ